MLKIHDLTVGYGDMDILRNINLEVPAGETLAVVGESGTGKTTLGLSLMGLVEERSGAAKVEGEICIDEVDVTGMDARELQEMRWTQVSMVFQNTDDALNPVHTVLQQVVEPLEAHGICEGEDADDRGRDMLQQAGLGEDRFGAYPHELSVGEKQRVLIAMALVCDPEVVVLDEPTSSLDAVSKQEIIDMLRRIGQDKVCLVITHDLSGAAALADRVAVLCGGRIVEVASDMDLFSRPRHPYTRGLIRCYPDMSRSKDLQGIRGRAAFVERGCPFHRRCTQAIDVCHSERPPLRSVEDRLLACHRGGIVPLLEVRDVAKSFGDRQVLDGLDATVYEGETLALVGESGAGKTTLARCLMGLTQIDGGQFFLEEEPVGNRTPDFCRRVQMIFQNPREALSHRMTVGEAVREPLNVQHIGTRADRGARVKTALRDAELPTEDGFLNRYPHHLSGGEIQRVVIARALVLEPEVLIADEPTSSLDVSVQAKIIKLLNTIQESRGLSMLLITHDIALARKASDRIAVLREGRVVENGPTGRVLSNPSHEYTRMLAESAHRLTGG